MSYVYVRDENNVEHTYLVQTRADGTKFYVLRIPDSSKKSGVTTRRVNVDLTTEVRNERIVRSPPPRARRECAQGEERSQKTGKCVKQCKAGFVRSPQTGRCKIPHSFKTKKIQRPHTWNEVPRSPPMWDQ